MKSNAFLFGFLVIFSFAALCGAQSSLPSPSPLQLMSPAIAPVPIAAIAPMPVGSVPVAEPAAPPQWAQDLIMSAQKFPVVGPYVTKIMVYAGIISSILTALAAFLLAALSTISGAFNLGGLAQAAIAVETFKKGKFMYWLQYLSMFNAKKPDQDASVVNVASLKSAS